MSKEKCYILDTNIIMRDPEVLNGFADNEVVLPEIVQRELDHLKTAPGQTGYEARQAATAIDAFYMRRDGNPKTGWSTRGGGTFRVETRIPEDLIPGYSVNEVDKADNRIIAVAKMLTEENKMRYDKQTILICGDKIMRQLAINAGVVAQTYKNEEVKNAEFDYSGWTEMRTCDMSVIDKLYQDGRCEVWEEDNPFEENEYAVIRCEKSSVLVRYHNGVLMRLDNFGKKGIYGVRPLNARQSFQMDACVASPDEIPCVIVKGAAGTGKTYIAEACALDALYDGRYERIILTRSMINPEGEGELGILPGDTREKMDPYLRPFYDNLEQLIRSREPKEDTEQIRIAIDDLLVQGQIEIQPMSSIRGRTFTNSYIIIDEAQNTTAKQIETLITRLGNGSKLVILGCLDQIDTSRLSRYSNGLAVASDRMKGSVLTAQITYQNEDGNRSPIAKDAVLRFART